MTIAGESPPSPAAASATSIRTEAVSLTPYTAPSREIWGWAAGRVAEFGLVSSVGQAMTIFTVGFGLSPVIMSWCVMFPRLLDGIVDPILGHWSDELHTPWGRRKPFMLIGAVGGAIFLAALWWANPHWRPTTQCFFIGAIITCLYVCYGAYTMAWTAVGFELSDDYHERSRIQAIGGVFLAAMVLLNSWVYWLALRPIFGGVVWGIRWIGCAIAAAVVISAIISTYSVRERFTHANHVHVKLFPAIRATMRNRPFVLLIVMKIFETFGGRLAGGMSFFLGVYYVCRGDQNLATKIAGIAATIGTAWSFAALPMVKPAGKLLGKRGALIAGAALSLFAAAAAFFITTPSHPYWGMVPGLLIAPLLVISNTIASAILPDICDMDELQTGQRREGLFTAVMAFVSKLEISAAVVLVGYVVSWSSIDTTIGMRWASTIDNSANVAAQFAVGESGVVQLHDAQPRAVNALEIDGFLASVELSASSVSSTEGFRRIGTFVQITDGKKRFTFPAVSAAWFRLELLPAVGRSTTLRAVHFFSADDNSELTRTAIVIAAHPPDAIVNRLYWIVLVPALAFSILTLLAAILFPLTEAQMREVRRLLDDRKLPVRMAE